MSNNLFFIYSLVVLEECWLWQQNAEGKAGYVRSSIPATLMLPAELNSLNAMNPARFTVHNWDQQGLYLLCQANGMSKLKLLL